MLDLQPIERRSGLDSETFAAEFLEPMMPVVFTDLMANWPAREKWTIDYFKTKYGHLRVPVVSNNYSKPGKGYMSPDRVISFQEYLEILESGPTDLRIFLWNIFREAPELREDFRIPTIMDGFVNELPFMFFGGQGSKVAMHYDIDMSNVFLNQIHGRKRVILFAPDQSRKLYQHPFTVASYVDINRPDLHRFPALAFAKGYEVMLGARRNRVYPVRLLALYRIYRRRLFHQACAHSVLFRPGCAVWPTLLPTTWSIKA